MSKRDSGFIRPLLESIHAFAIPSLVHLTSPALDGAITDRYGTSMHTRSNRAALITPPLSKVVGRAVCGCLKGCGWSKFSVNHLCYQMYEGIAKKRFVKMTLQISSSAHLFSARTKPGKIGRKLQRDRSPPKHGADESALDCLYSLSTLLH